MADKCGPDEVSTDNAKKAIEGAADLSEPDRALSLQVLDLMNRAPNNLAARLTQQPVCHSEQMFLGRAKLSVSPAGLKSLDEALVPGLDSRPKEKPGFIVYDGTASHAIAVARVLATGTENVQIVSTDIADKIDPKKFVRTPDGISNITETERKQLLVAGAIGESVARDLKKLLPAVQQNPGVVINISMALSDVGLKGIGAKTNDTRILNIGFDDLDMKGIESTGEINKKFLQELEGQLRARVDSDIRAKNTLSLVDGLRELADAGAQIRLAWGNEDVVAINKLLAQLHPNIKAVSALDANGNVADYNKDTAFLTAEKRPGTVLLMSKEQMENIDRSKVGTNVTLIEKPSSVDDLSGNKLDESWMKSSNFRKLKDLQPVAEQILGVEKTLMKTRAGFHGDVQPEELKALYDKLAKADPKETQRLLGSKSNFVDGMLEIGRHDTTQMSDEQLKEHLSKNAAVFDHVYKIFRGSLSGELSKLGYSPKEGQTDRQALEEAYMGFVDLSKTGVLNKRELREMFGEQAEAFLKAQGKNGAYLFKLSGPSLFDTPPDGYVTLKDMKGAHRLAQEWVGTSFASPVAARDASNRFVAAKSK